MHDTLYIKNTVVCSTVLREILNFIISVCCAEEKSTKKCVNALAESVVFPHANFCLSTFSLPPPGVVGSSQTSSNGHLHN